VHWQYNVSTGQQQLRYSAVIVSNASIISSERSCIQQQPVRQSASYIIRRYMLLLPRPVLCASLTTSQSQAPHSTARHLRVETTVSTTQFTRVLSVVQNAPEKSQSPVSVFAVISTL